MDFALLVYHRVKNRRKRKDKQILGPCLRAEKAIEHRIQATLAIITEKQEKMLWEQDN